MAALAAFGVMMNKRGIDSSERMNIESIAEQYDMDVDFVQWFFDNKKSGSGNFWFVILAAMWEARVFYESRDNDLRAQGVEILAKHMRENGYVSEANGAEEFASQLRKGMKS
ncbi:hypothetical protein RYR42_003649 [Edwardsiella piscicida]|nr:hypothetical protein [Edwardsiella piscicida]